MIRTGDGSSSPPVGPFAFAKAIVHQRVAEPDGILGFGENHLARQAIDVAVECATEYRI